jgi:hypothetical protein
MAAAHDTWHYANSQPTAYFANSQPTTPELRAKLSEIADDLLALIFQPNLAQ